MVQAISACPGSVAEILALIERIRADEIKVDEVVEAIIDPNEVLLNELGLGHLESSAPAESAEVAENNEDADSDEETDEEADAEAISSANLEELKQKTLEHFRTIEQDYNKMVAALTKHDSKHASYLEYRDAIAAKLLEVRFATRQIESLSSSLRARVDNIRKLEREIRDMLEVEPQGVAALAEIAPGVDLPPLPDIEADLEKMRRDRERLGAVNLRAEEELREVEAQHLTLTTERDDLVEAIKKLRTGIQSLNKEARERLLTSFETVNAHFKRLFTELFGGGQAELTLIESDDPLEAGLEIIAKPPGKKPQTLSLLSGGEQALTALALIFAVFLTNPSPICVLDEVDAPLDDHNVERFCNLLHEMTSSTETRFIIITHNPITMARMNRLFGVTMAERGVSQLVSVDLESAVKILDQNVA